MKLQNSSNAVYSLIARNRTPIVNPGEKVEIEILLSGYGMPDKNKLHIQWSSPFVIDSEAPGELTFCLKCATDQGTGEIHPVMGEEALDTRKLDLVGKTVNLNRGYFLETPREDAPDFGIRGVVSERTWDKHPPNLLRLNTIRNARAGDYEVTLTFTYGNKEKLLQDYKVVPFHVTSKWERLQWLIYVGVGIAFASLVITAVDVVLRWIA